MEISALAPILELIASSEERMCKKFDLLHDEIKEQRSEVKEIRDLQRIQNGNVAKNTIEIEKLRSEAAVRVLTCGKVNKDIQGHDIIWKNLEFVSQHPKTSLLILVGSLAVLQYFVLELVRYDVLKSFFDYIKLIA